MWPLGLTLAMTLTLNFQGPIWNLLYLNQKWYDCHETKSKHIGWAQGLKCDHQVWPWPWPWIFKVKYGICYNSAKNGPIAKKRKANISIELKASNVAIGFDLGHDLELEFSRENIEFAISQPKVVRLAQNKKQTSIELQASNVTNGFDHDHDLWIFTVKCDLDLWPQTWPWPWVALSQNGKADWHWTKGVGVGHSWPWPFVTKVRCKNLPDSDRCDFRCRRAVDFSSFMVFSFWVSTILLNLLNDTVRFCCGLALRWSIVDIWIHLGADLTHCGLVTLYGDLVLGYHWLK